MVPLQLLERGPVAQHHPLGASTGYMEEQRGDWGALVDAALETSSFAVELAALSETELPGLLAFLHGAPPLPFRYADVTPAIVKTQGFLAWAVMDRRSGEIIGSQNLNATSTTASMIKAWLASDYLRRADEKGETPSTSRVARTRSTIQSSSRSST